MKTTVDALKGLYEKLGGEADVDQISTIPDMIDELTTVAQSGGAVITKDGETLVIK